MAQMNYGPNEAEQDRDFKIALMSLHENTRSKFYLFEVRKSGRNRSTRICTSRSRGGMSKKGLNKKTEDKREFITIPTTAMAIRPPHSTRWVRPPSLDGCGRA